MMKAEIMRKIEYKKNSSKKENSRNPEKSGKIRKNPEKSGKIRINREKFGKIRSPDDYITIDIGSLRSVKKLSQYLKYPLI